MHQEEPASSLEMLFFLSPYHLLPHDQYWFFSLSSAMPVFICRQQRLVSKTLILQGYIKYSEGLIQSQLCPVFQVSVRGEKKGVDKYNERLCINQPFPLQGLQSVTCM